MDKRELQEASEKKETGYFVTAEGKYHGMYFLDEPPDEGVQVPEMPPSYDYVWDFKAEEWIDLTESGKKPEVYKALRLAEYIKIPMGEQFDAIYKFAVAAGVRPNPQAEPGTPERWVADITAIKEKYPKE